jgi:hypothetical protein
LKEITLKRSEEQRIEKMVEEERTDKIEKEAREA